MRRASFAVVLIVCLEQRCKPSAEIVALMEMLIDAMGLPMDDRVDLLEVRQPSPSDMTA